MAESPEERAMIEERIKTILKELDEHQVSAEKSVDSMLPCVIQKAKP